MPNQETKDFYLTSLVPGMLICPNPRELVGLQIYEVVERIQVV